jgi:hypothetical protein
MSPDIFEYFRRYDDVPRGAILKEDLLRLGVSVSADVTDRMGDYWQKTYNLFTSTYNRNLVHLRQTHQVPAEFRFHSEEHDMLPTVVETRHSTSTPYQIAVDGDAFVLAYNGRLIADVQLMRRPPYHDRAFADGTRYRDVAALVHWGYKIAISVVRVCGYTSELCKFCDINSNHKLRTDGAKLNTDPLAKLEYVVPVVKEIFKTSQFEGSRTLVYGLTGGTMLEQNESVEADIYAAYIKRIKAEVGGRYPVSVTCTARSEEELWKLKDAGLDVYQSNIEVWDRGIFEKVCPGKARFVGYDNWISLLKTAVDVFGEGNVITNFVAGVELTQAYGFKTLDEALKSTTEGFEYLMSHGITPKLSSFCASAGTPLRNEPILPLDYYVQVARAWYRLWRKHCLPPVRNHGPMGPGRAIEINSAYNDIGS